jgi:signal transduction histidine kinase
MNDPSHKYRDHLTDFLLRHKDQILTSWMHHRRQKEEQNNPGCVQSCEKSESLKTTVTYFLSLCLNHLEENDGKKVTEAKLSLWIDENKKMGLKLPDIVESIFSLKRIISRFIMDRLYYKPREVKTLDQDINDIFDHTLFQLSISFSDDTGHCTCKDQSSNPSIDHEVVENIKNSEMRLRTLSSISREIHPPLTSIIDHTRSIVDRMSDNSGGEFIEVLQDAKKAFSNAQNLMNIMNNSMEWGKIEDHEISLKPESFDLKQCVMDVMSTVSPMLTEKGIRSSLRSPDILPPLYADSRRTRQIILNLLTNAVENTPPKGNIAIEIAPLTRQNGQENGSSTKFIKVTVIDNGIGIDMEKIPFISEKLSEVEKNSDADNEGICLGLYIARRLVELQGGEIWSKNSRRKGSRFSFTLPTVHNEIVHLDSQVEMTGSDTPVN